MSVTILLRETRTVEYKDGEREDILIECEVGCEAWSDVRNNDGITWWLLEGLKEASEVIFTTYNTPKELIDDIVKAFILDQECWAKLYIDWG